MRKSVLSMFISGLLLMFSFAFLVACKGETDGISLDASARTIYVGESFSLTATAPEGEAISWETSDEQVATVLYGKVTAVGEGNAVITAKLESGDSASCSVTVLPILVTISQESAVIDLDDPAENRTVSLTATANDGGEIVWISSDPALATVEGGFVSATGYGVGTVTITAQRGNVSAECVVTIIQSSRPADWSLLEERSETGAMQFPGVWAYYAEGDLTYFTRPWQGGDSVGVTFERGPAAGNLFAFLLQPDFGADDYDLYKISFTLTVNADAAVKIGKGETFTVAANAPCEVTYTGHTSTVAPFSVRIEGMPDGGTVTLTHISLRPGSPVPDDAEGPEPGDALECGGRVEALENTDTWYYTFDGDEVEPPREENGSITFGFGGAEGTLQFFYQPAFPVGTTYTATFTISVTAACRVLYSNDAVAYDFEAAGVYSFRYTDIVDDEPFCIAITPVGDDLIITISEIRFTESFTVTLTVGENGRAVLNGFADVNGVRAYAAGEVVVVTAIPDDGYEVATVVKDGEILAAVQNIYSFEINAHAVVEVTFRLIEKEDPEHPELPVTGERLAERTNEEAVAAPGAWYYRADSAAFSYVRAPYIEDGSVSVTFRTAPNPAEGTYFYFLYQPTFGTGDLTAEIGGAYTARFTIILGIEAEVRLGLDDGVEEGTELVSVKAGTPVMVSYEGKISGAAPFSIRIERVGAESLDGVTFTISNYSFLPSEAPPEESSDIVKEYDLTRSFEAEVTGNPGKWFYVAEGAFELAEVPRYANNTLSIAFNRTTAGADYRLLFQPEFEVGTAYTFTCNVTVDAKCTIVCGGVRFVFDVPGSNVFTCSGVVGDVPLSIQLIPQNASSPIQLIVENISLVAK